MKSKINIFSLFILIFILGGISYFLYSQNILLDLDSIINFTESFGIFSYIIFFLIVLIEVVAAPIPGVILYIAGGILFGTFIGGTIAFLANVAGATVAFFIGRKFILKDSEKKQKKDYFNKAIEKYGGYTMFLLRVNPLTSSDIFSYLAGISKMNFKKFLTGTTLGLLPLIYIQSYLGEEIITKNEFLFNTFLIISLIYVLIFVYLIIHRGLFGWIMKKFR